MKLLILTPEHPVQNPGGHGTPVGHAVQAVAQAYIELGHEVRIAVPQFEPRSKTGWRELGGVRTSFLRTSETQIWAGSGKDENIRLLCHPDFERPHAYVDQEGWDHHDNAFRFAVFGASALISCAVEGWQPDAIHANEWQSGLGLLYSAHHLKDVVGQPRRLFTIHDAAYQGLCDIRWASEVGLGSEWLVPDQLEFWGRLNLLKAGLVSADVVTASSQHYIEALRRDHHGYGLEGLFRSLGRRVRAVCPGIDCGVWHDGVPRDPKELQAWKRVHRERVLPGTLPLAVFASPFRQEQGIDLLLTLLPDLLKMNVVIAFSGNRDTPYWSHLEAVARTQPDRVVLLPAGDEASQHDLLAAADLLLLPVGSEPGGDLYAKAMAVGTPVVAHRTGAAADRIVSWPKAGADGFLFEEWAPDVLLRQMRKALGLVGKPEEWLPLCARAAARDFGWRSCARDYLEVLTLAEGGK